MANESKLVNEAVIAGLNGRPHEQQRVVDALTDFIRMYASEEGYNLPAVCPAAEGEVILYRIEGVALYCSDIRLDADIRETLARRLRLYNCPRPLDRLPAQPTAKVDDVFVTCRFNQYVELLHKLTGVGPWQHIGGHGAPRADSVTIFRLTSEHAVRDFYADVSLSDDRRRITVEFR